MTIYRVTTQTDLDAALAKAGRYDEVVIDSPAGVWLEVSSSGSASVSASGSASVSASGSASVRAYDSASVRAYDSASVSASGSASVRAYDSASVRASGSASVRASGSASVSASGSASVRAYGSASVRASKHVAVHLHSGHATVDGGVLIDLTTLDLADATTWCDHHGVTVEDGHAILFKAVNDQLRSDRGFDYPLGATVTAPDWRDTDECGYGLHFGPTPHHADAYHHADTVRYLAVRVPLAGLRPITGGGTAKAKAQTVQVLHEVDVHGQALATEVPA